jgi:hypothetical protein
VSEVFNRVGLDAANSGCKPSGGWWPQLSVTTDTPPILNGTIMVSGVSGKNTDGMSLAFFANSSGVTLRCNTGSTTPPASSVAGESC